MILLRVPLHSNPRDRPSCHSTTTIIIIIDPTVEMGVNSGSGLDNDSPSKTVSHRQATWFLFYLSHLQRVLGCQWGKYHILLLLHSPGDK